MDSENVQTSERYTMRTTWYDRNDMTLEVVAISPGAEEIIAELIKALAPVGPIDEFSVTLAYAADGGLIGNAKEAEFICDKLKIWPEKASPEHKVCSIGKSSNGKWYGWSHRAICGFAVGDVLGEDHLATRSGSTAEYLAQHPEADLSLPVGFVCATESDCRRAAIAFADSVG